jgi:hypothetical protein
MLPNKKNFDISFINRSIDILTGYQDRYEFTALINILLALIIIPNEVRIKKKKSFKFDFFERKMGTYSILKEIFKMSDIKLLNEEGKEYTQKKFFYKTKLGEQNINTILLGDFIRRIRNGITHYSFDPVIENNKWIGIIIQNYKAEFLNFEVYFTENELKEFALFIAKKYVETVEKK